MDRYATLDGMRGVAALLVLVRHVTHHTALPLFTGAGIAVDLFFCLSGFVIAHAYRSRLAGGMGVREFVARRLLRLYPMFLVGMALGTVALSVRIATGQSTLTPAQGVLATALNLLYLPYAGSFSTHYGRDWISASLFPADDPAWSLFFEWSSYLLFAGLAARTGRVPARTLAAAGAAALVAAWAVLGWVAGGWGMDDGFDGVARALFGFFAGVALQDRVAAGGLRAPRVPPAWILAAVALLCWWAWSDLRWLVGTLVLSPALVLAGSVAVPRSPREAAVLSYLGWLSYPLYCVHFPIYSLLSAWAGDSLAVSGAAGVLSLAAAHWLARRVDEPVRAALARRFGPAG